MDFKWTSNGLLHAPGFYQFSPPPPLTWEYTPLFRGCAAPTATLVIKYFSIHLQTNVVNVNTQLHTTTVNIEQQQQPDVCGAELKVSVSPKTVPRKNVDMFYITAVSDIFDRAPYVPLEGFSYLHHALLLPNFSKADSIFRSLAILNMLIMITNVLKTRRY